MAYQKRVITGGSEKRSNREHRIKKENTKAQEQDAFILFDADNDYTIEKLSTDDLPDSINGTPITWVVNFSVKDTKGNYISGVTYSLLIPPGPAKAKFVIFDGVTVSYYPGTPASRRHNNQDFVEVRLNLGDPGGGWTPGG